MGTKGTGTSGTGKPLEPGSKAPAFKLPRDVVDDLLQAIGVVSCLYAVWDVGSDVVARETAGSDASALGLLTGIPAVLWGLAWIALSLVVVFFTLRLVARGR